MKTLYLPVFWCGFTLSVSALYLSSERFSLGNESDHSPVLMQIEPKISLDVPTTSPLGTSAPESSKLEPLPETPQLNPEEVLWQERTNSFLSAAKDALN